MRRALGASLVLIVVVITIGCNNATKPAGGTSPSLSISQSKGNGAGQSGDARISAEAFLKALIAGDAKTASAKVHIGFKKYVAPPFFSDDQAAGFSEADVQKYLLKLMTGNTSSAIHGVATYGESAAFRGELTGSDSPRFFTLRLMREPGGWTVTHFQASRQVAKLVSLPERSSDLAWPIGCAQDFLDLVTGGPDDHDLSMRLMSEDCKKRLPSPSIADAGLGYAKKDVRNWLNAQRSECTGYSLTNADKEGSGVVVRGELVGPVRRQFALFIALTGGNWLVERFDVK
jgi:hypothetical protein